MEILYKNNGKKEVAFNFVVMFHNKLHSILLSCSMMLCFGSNLSIVTLKSSGKLEDTYETMLDNMKKMESVKKNYGNQKEKTGGTTNMLESPSIKKKRKVESNACLKANKKKLSHPNV